jgi:transcription initiation factor TFIIIB Brf1 subunit/transcription initiation factor TFIIB
LQQQENFYCQIKKNSAGTVNCPQCGSTAIDGAKFCEECGAVLEDTGTNTGISQKDRHSISKNPENRGFIKKHLVVIIISLVLAAAAAGYFLSQNSLSVQSDPTGADIYFDSEFKGTTPSVIRNVFPGVHNVELRHENYPPWHRNITIPVGRPENIVADLSENLIPSLTLACRSGVVFRDAAGSDPSAATWAGTCIYAQGEDIQLSGTAVRPFPKQNPNAQVSVKSADTSSGFSARDYDVRIGDNFTYSYTIPGAGIPSGNFIVTAKIPSGQSSNVTVIIESPADTVTRTLQEIVEDYHRIHTYSLVDYYVCADMAQDVWNIVDTKGIRALLVAGNINNPDARWKDYNHVWVIAEISPKQWIALETTAGRLVRKSENQNYFKGTFFASPKDLKTNIDLRRDYNNEIARSQAIASQYNAKLTEYNTQLDRWQSLTNSFNSNYAGRPLTPAEYDAAMTLKNTILTEESKRLKIWGELEQITATYNNEKQIIDTILAQMTELAEKGSRLMNT